MLLDQLSYRSLQWLVVAFLTLHNLEEGLTAPAYFPKVEGLLAGRAPGWLQVSVPAPGQFFAALVGATVVPLLLVAFAARGRQTAFKSYLVVAVQALVLVNVFLPHIPSAIIFGGYAPGVVTAVLINLPFSFYFFRRSLREARITRGGLILVLVLALPALLLSVLALYALGETFAAR